MITKQTNNPLAGNLSTKIIPWKKIISICFWSIVGVFLAIFTIRILVWENTYYSEKIGSPRDIVGIISDEEAVDETIPTAEEIAEYTVAADLPRYLSIPYLGISDSRVVAVGLNANRELKTPNNIFDVGWYNTSSKPGAGGVILIDGHNGGPNIYGVFKRLPLLCARGDTSTRSIETGESRTCTGTSGDIINIERGNGAFFTYEVIDNITVPLSEADSYMATALTSPISGVESLSLITCTGEWSSPQQTYLSRQFLRAILVD